MNRYYIGHNKKSDDVIITTASKNMQDTCDMMSTLLGEDWEDNEDYKVILIEIKEVDTN